MYSKSVSVDYSTITCIGEDGILDYAAVTIDGYNKSGDLIMQIIVDDSILNQGPISTDLYRLPESRGQTIHRIEVSIWNPPRLPPGQKPVVATIDGNIITFLQKID